MLMHSYVCTCLQLYERRYEVTHDGKVREKFIKLILDYMLEESNAVEEGNMSVRQQPWRSDSMYCDHYRILLEATIIIIF